MKNGYKKFIILWIGELISTIGSGLTSFGLGVYVFNLTGSATDMAMITLLGFLPGLLLSVLAGMLADRFDRRLLMILGDGLSGCGIVLILIMMIIGKCELWHIYLGVTISSVFSSLLQPAFNATISDLVGEENYTKASGLVSIAGSSRFLVSPILAGILLASFDIKVLLIIDICTFFITVFATFFVRRGLESKKREKENFKEFVSKGINSIFSNKGIVVLVVITSLINLFMGFIQVLSESMVLDFADSKTLGICESICASGMLVSSIVVGAIGIKKHQYYMLIVSLITAGVGMVGFGLVDNLFVIIPFGFIFFAALPLANSSLDFMVRKNIAIDCQGRAYGIIGFVSQLGSVISFATCGLIADGIHNASGITVGRSSGIVISFGGALLVVVALSLFFFKSVKKLENSNLIY